MPINENNWLSILMSRNIFMLQVFIYLQEGEWITLNSNYAVIPNQWNPVEQINKSVYNSWTYKLQNNIYENDEILLGIKIWQ